MSTTDTTGADSAPLDDLKARHRRMWALGDYPRVAREIVSPLGGVLVDALDVGAGERVLDVAAGTGSAAVRAAGRGATVTASDLTPELLEAGRAEHPDEDLTWDVADAEALPYGDAAFDVVLSAIGVMFAPHHQQAADELVRTCRPGGRIGVVSWTPEGTIGRLFATMRPYVPAPPPGVSPPPLWGTEDHVRGLFGDRVDRWRVERRVLPVDHFDDGAGFRDYFAAHYGPTIAAYAAHSGDPERTADLDRDLAALGDREGTAGPDGFAMQWEYLLMTGEVV
ncbi:methyltransferase domain-containing protein [Aeromicrobium senzhongii]|uniref:Methyltransferase domain-containing protein n=1 Tax=Aeromicrobium senzhongii TaxID=2663859 RepID=A0ABX6SRW7_9ACTN|nr:class I SAM-dependent methyltransferase [Aeromicrobium senzhongii]MTB88547.1 methyltransferase domain-containing protein [Aeromicrobium senzhongii]QNL94139.1 methyltransferase domain-containing protein [Aeromicrobium senzhongii]